MNKGLQNKTTRINSTINVTPMVDVMLVLLIIFMVVTPMIHGTRIRLAAANNPIAMPDADKADALIVSVMHDGKIFFNAQAINSDELTQKIKGGMASANTKIVFVRADARVRYGILVNTVDDVRSAGVDQLGLLTEKKLR